MNDIPKNRPRVSVDLVAFLSSWAFIMQDSAHNDHNYERREISRTHEAEFREAFKQAEADADELEALRARVTELEASASEVFTAMLVEIDGHTYGLRPWAARVVREALKDAEFAHRFAVLLECAVCSPLDSQKGAWDEACALLDEYKRSCAAIDAAIAKDGA